ncbi:hypothetical protein PRIPAC_94084 [Pristionchus pacificus]|uniref:Uncharacterized protein n=1 Tax=Pristionchus pacificus TaxID=54126 RepID=A0A2A6BBD8_PRIPA|nr:hypothetical protein PRIPAC_94084 [Pristionchus pacificus]|eukprot:PDM63199.1 hypothetical protein PRIPAC_50414 [Pristionchus pacificus]
MSSSYPTLFSALPKISLGPVATEFQMRSMRQRNRRIDAPYLHDYQVAQPIIHEPPTNSQMVMLWIRPLIVVVIWFFVISFTLSLRFDEWTRPSTKSTTRSVVKTNSTAK